MVSQLLVPDLGLSVLGLESRGLSLLSRGGIVDSFGRVTFRSGNLRNVRQNQGEKWMRIRS